MGNTRPELHENDMRFFALLSSLLLVMVLGILYVVDFTDIKVDECLLCRQQIKYKSNCFRRALITTNDNAFSTWYDSFIEPKHAHIWHIRASGTYSVYGNLTTSHNVGS